jgi:hypothetical protein
MIWNFRRSIDDLDFRLNSKSNTHPKSTGDTVEKSIGGLEKILALIKEDP